jgi:ATP-binding cassette, subfamily B, bacterial
MDKIPLKQTLSYDKKPLIDTFKQCSKFLFKKQKIRILTLIFIVLIAGIIPSVDSVFLQQLTDAIEFYSDQDLKKINLISIIFQWVIIYGIWWESQNLIWRLYDYAYLKIMPQVKARVVDEIYNHIQFHSHDYFQKNLAGDIANRITESSRSLEMIFAYTNEKIIKRFAIIIFALFTLFFVHKTVAIIFLTWIIIFVSISLYFSQTINKYSTIYGRDKALVAGKIVDVISNISVVRMFSSHEHERKYLNFFLDKSVSSDQNMQWFMLKLRYVLGLSCSIMICTIIYYIITLRNSLDITVGEGVLIITLCLTIVADIWDLTQELGDLFEQIGSFSQSMTLLEKLAIKDKKNAHILKVKEPKIEFKNVTLNYNNHNNNFKNQSITIHSKQRVGLVGFSGSGKTTFASMIARLYEIDNGEILIDGQNIKYVTQGSLRQNISFIPQEPILFHRSVKDNIRYGKLDATDKEIFEAAKSAHIHEFIMNLPEGYDTICGERGNNFSGGQRQRIVIARAFLKQAPILILDEATSSLDIHTEHLIQQSLQQLMLNKTVIVIAHRLSTLLNMDRILVFDKGHIVEDGSHSTLQKNGVLYKLLWNAV